MICSLSTHLGKRNWQTVGVYTNGQLDTFTFPLGGWHHKPHTFRLEFLVGLFHIINVETY